jgi:hypothetical protein
MFLIQCSFIYIDVFPQNGSRVIKMYARRPVESMVETIVRPFHYEVSLFFGASFRKFFIAQISI